MLRPSYAELMDVLNRETGDMDEITSRYTIVIAAAKRARQIIDGDEPMVPEIKGKPLSTAVDELYNSKIKVVPEGEGTAVYVKGELKDNIQSNDSEKAVVDFKIEPELDDAFDEIDSDELISDDDSEI